MLIARYRYRYRYQTDLNADYNQQNDCDRIAACLELGVSVSRLALNHGVNANLVQKWMKKTTEERPLPLVSVT